MDRDNGKFYETEEETLPAEAEETKITMDDDEVNDIKFFSELLVLMRKAIENGGNVPFSSKKIVDADRCLMILDDMEHNLPDAIQYGMQMYNERGRLLNTARQSAQECVASAEMRARNTLDEARREAEQRIIEAENEADAILSDAQERADHKVEESEVLRVAQEEARAIRNDAHVEANELRLKASHAAYQMLSSVEQELSEMLKVVRRHRMELGDGRE